MKIATFALVLCSAVAIAARGSAQQSADATQPPGANAVERATQWPQFRGPGARGAAEGAGLPDRWSATENVAWKRDIPGRGWSSPIVWGDRVFLTTVINTGMPEEPKKGLYFGGDRPRPADSVHQWKVYCLDLTSGDVHWERQVHEGKPESAIHLKSSYASETPVTDGERLYCYFGNLGVFCFDFDGQELWRHNVKPHPTRYGWGTASSPTLHGDRLYLVNDNEEDSYLLALDVQNGQELWRIPRDEKSNWATPFVWENGQRTEIVTPGTGEVRSYDLEGKPLWSLKGMSSITIATPYQDGDLLYLSSGYVLDKQRPIYAIRPGASGDISLQDGATSNEFIAWSQPNAAPYNPTTLVYDNRMYVLYDRGLLACFNARDGKEIFGVHRLPNGRAFTSSPWAYQGKVFCLNEDGVTLVLKAGDAFEVLHANELAEDDMGMATPAIAGDRLLIRTSARIYCIRSEVAVAGRKPAIGCQDQPPPSENAFRPVTVALKRELSPVKGYWPGWLGPNRDGWVAGFTPPAPWPERLERGWQVDVGVGYGSPLVAGGRVFQHARQDEEEVLWCLDLKTGTVIWRQHEAVAFKIGGGGEKHGKGPKSSPLYADGRVFTLSITGDLSAWNAESGALLWRSDYGPNFKTNHPYWGASASPIVDGDRVMVRLGNDDQGLLVALDVETGAEVWRHGDDGPSYSSPLVAEIEGVRQVVEWNHRALIGVESASGKPLWEYPFPHSGSDQNMPTPVVHNGRVLLGGENRGIRCLAPRLDAGIWRVDEVWRQDTVALDMSSAVMNQDLLYGFSHYGKGRLFCLDPGTGEVLWQGPGRTGQNAAFLSIPGFVAALLNTGELKIVAASGERFEAVASYQVAETETWAPPVLLDGGLLVKDEQKLTLWSLSSPPADDEPGEE